MGVTLPYLPQPILQEVSLDDRLDGQVELPDDASLVSACLKGNAEAWDRLVGRYAGLVFAVPLRYGLTEQEAADVSQSVWLTVLEKLSTLRRPGSLAPWLTTVATRATWEAMRRRSHPMARSAVSPHSWEPTGGPDEEGYLREEQDPAPLPEELVLSMERQALVREAVRSLPSNCRELLTSLFLEEDVSYQELAKRLGVPQNSVGPTRARCLEKLRRALQNLGYR